MMEHLWLGTEASYLELKERMDNALAHAPPEARLMFGDDDDGRNPLKFELVDGVAVGQIDGPLVTKSSWLTRYLGITSYDDIAEGLSKVAANSKVNAIVLDYDTPGGAAKGCKACADFIREFGEKVKPVYSHSEQSVASAGTWLYSAGLHHSLSADAEIGSVGVLMIHSSYKKARETQGIVDTVFRSAEYKALGHPFEELSDAAKAEIEEHLNKTHETFVTNIADLSGIDRTKVSNKIANGKMFSSSEGRSLGLVDNILPLGKLIVNVAKQHRPSESNGKRK